MPQSQIPEEPRRDGSGDESGNFDDEFLGADASARRRLNTPAVLLMIASAITAIFCFVAFVRIGFELLFWMTANQGHHAPRHPGNAQPSQNWDDGNVIELLTLSAFVGIVYSVVIFRGAKRMRQFENHREARNTVLLGMFSIIFLHVASVFVLPCAIWAWVVLKDPLVKKQFRSL